MTERSTQLERILTALGGAVTGVLATLSGGQIRQRVVYFGYDDDLAIYFTSLRPSAKVAQLRENPDVSFLVVRTDADPEETEQVEVSGQALILLDSAERQRCLEATARSSRLVGNLIACGQTDRLECVQIVPRRVQYRRHGDLQRGIAPTVIQR